jgi:hypothetical protein
VRRLETLVHAWELTPDADVLSNGAGGDVYTATADDGRRVVYFPAGGRAAVPLAPGPYEVAWVGPGGSLERESLDLTAGSDRALAAPGQGHWVAVARRR